MREALVRQALSSPEAYVDAVGGAVDTVDVVIGHSGAGALLPTVAANTTAAATVFIDALVPDTAEVFMPSGRIIELRPAYDNDRIRAEQWGWPTCRLVGHHLDLVSRPDAIARIVTDLVGAAHKNGRLDPGVR